MTTKIAILGDFNLNYSTHHALNDSLKQIKAQFNEDIQFDWIGTDLLDIKTAFTKYAGLLVAPGSPYKDVQNVLNAIAYARQNNIPTLGNCGGFQHMIIEFARNVCGIVNADHEETNPDSPDLLISKLSCSLVEQAEELTIVDTHSILFKSIRKNTFLGKYFCSYGINEKYIDALESKGLSVTAISKDGHVRAFELKTHPFFLGTLFQPALTSTRQHLDPIIKEFIKVCLPHDVN